MANRTGGGACLSANAIAERRGAAKRECCVSNLQLLQRDVLPCVSMCAT